MIDVILQCEEWGLRYYNMPPEVIGWGDYSKYRPDVEEMEDRFSDLLERIRDISEITDVLLSMHAANFCVPTSDDPLVLERSLREIAVERRALEMCGGGILYIHPGYAQGDIEAAREKVIQRLNSLPHSMVSIGIEVDDVGMGDLETVLYLAQSISGAVPVIDFAHLFGRGYTLGSANDYLFLLNEVRPLSGNRIFTHFSAVANRKHMGLQGHQPDYRVCARAIAQSEAAGGPEVVVLVESPNRELDACLFRDAYEQASLEIAA